MIVSDESEARMDRQRRAARYRFAQYVEQEVERGTLDPDEVRRERAQEQIRRVQGARDMVTRANEAIEQAERDGFFEGNPYHGKPLPGNHGGHDPDWWIRGYVERERITGLGPPALALRKEDAELDDRLDAESSEERVREIVTDFDARVIEARRQLMGGPPVVTPVRDVDEEVARWRARRADAEAERAQAEPPSPPRRRAWFRRSR
jgi:hypothetical protein